MKWLCLNQRAGVWLTLSIERNETDTENDAGDVEQEAPEEKKIS